MNKYEIIGIVGEGAYGIVYKAKNKDTGEYGKAILYFTYILWILLFYFISIFSLLNKYNINTIIDPFIYTIIIIWNHNKLTWNFNINIFQIIYIIVKII